MSKMRVGLVAMVVLLAIGLQSVIADTEVSGNITSDTTWTVAGSPYIVVGHVTVDSGVTLTIEPGVTVRFNDSLSLNIAGELIARATVDDSIFFTSNNATPQPGDWGSIKFLGNSVDAILDTLGNYVSGCIIEYCSIEYGGDVPGESNYGAIHCNASPLISKSTITNNSRGVYCSSSSPRITHNTITHNSSGVYLRSGSGLTLENNRICDNSGDGIRCHSCSEGIIADNLLSENSGTGIWMDYCSNISIVGNTIAGNSGGGIGYAWYARGTIADNTITANSFGIFLYERTSFTITNNTISNNLGSAIILRESENVIVTHNIIAGNSGSGIELDRYTHATIDSNTITGNSADRGGGIRAEREPRCTITGNSITGNSAGDGGGIYYSGTSGTTNSITNNTITGNYASNEGGAIWCSSDRVSPTIMGNTITGNSAGGAAGGIYCSGSPSPTINYNNLVNEGEYEIYLYESYTDIDATNNWWGTTNTDTIGARIWDYYDDSTLGEVLYDPILNSPAMGMPESVYSVVLKSDETYTTNLTTDLWIGTTMYIQLEGEDSDSISVNQTTVTITSDLTDTVGIRIALTETDSISGIFRGTALIDTVSVEDVSIGAAVGETITTTSTVDSTKFITVLVGHNPRISNLDIAGSEDIEHLVSHYPIVTWSYWDTLGLPQDAFQVQVGIDDDWSVVEMWDTVEVSSSDTSLTYAGDSLVDGETYYLRAKVKNSGGLWSSWANLSFRMNSLPTIPAGLSPHNGQILGDSVVTLIISNSTDGEGDTLTYNFVVYSDTLMDSVVTSVTGVQEGTDSTSWQVDVPLEEEWPYSWRARAYDGFEYGEWMAVGSFIVNTEWSPPVIKSITDIPNDQGRQVTVSWYASEYDASQDTITITEYCLWRRIDSLSVSLSGREAKGDEIPSLKSFPPGDWHYVLTVPACGQEVYHCLAPTLCDSTVDGVCWSVFFVSAMTPEPLVYFTSEIDSGYSMDNLAPSTPQGLMAASGDTSINLAWNPIPEEDFRYYAVYRRTDPDTTMSLLGTTIDTSYSDSEVLWGNAYYYRISAHDFAGNESEYSDETGCEVGIHSKREGELPVVFSLSQNYPNPFNPVTEIRYALLKDCQVRLEVYSILGRRVAILVEGRQEAGYKSIRWDASEVASGVYFYRLQAGGFVQTRKMVLIR